MLALSDNQPMLDQPIIEHLLANPPESLAAKVSATVGRGKLSAVEVAEACAVTVQAVNGWKKNGRVDKRHIKTLAELTGLPAEWWLPGFERVRGGSERHRPLERGTLEKAAADSGSGLGIWPFSTPYAQYVAMDQRSKDKLDGFVAGFIANAPSPPADGKKSDAA